jgi:OOP family OmpA-OmpF porin
MQMKRSILALFILAANTAPAWAENDSRRYVEVGLGSASFSNISPSPHPNVFRVVTGYRFDPMLAAEIDYSMFGSFIVGNSVSSTSVSASSLQIAVAGTFPVSEDFDLIGRVGRAQNMAIGDTTIPGRSSDRIAHSDLFFGFGAQYYVTRQFSVRAEYDNYGKFENTASPLKASSVSIGVVYSH